MRNTSTLYKYKGINASHSTPYEVFLKRGNYLFELWGGSGNDIVLSNPIRSAYVSGYVVFRHSIKLYLHVGSQAYKNASFPSYGGGGPGQISGGGSSDIRLLPGDYGDFSGLKSRIIVSSGAGSSDGCYETGGPGGGLIGYNSTGNYGRGGTQISGGEGGIKGRFGFGAGNESRRYDGHTPDGNAGGGGGYFGGGNSYLPGNCGSGGGSSFISGHKGCISVLESSESEENLKFSESFDPSIHYSGIQFYHTVMIDGTGNMPNPLGGNETGHSGDGFIRITQIYLLDCPSYKYHYFALPFSSLFLFNLINES